MNEFEVLSVRDINFTNDEKQTISGAQLWVGAASAEAGWNGWEVSKIWIPDNSGLYPDVKLLRHGDRVNITFNHKGKPASIELAA